MAGRACRIGWVTWLVAGVLSGCQTSSRKPPYSDNPLLATRQPLIHSAADRERKTPPAQAAANPVLPPPVPLGPEPTTTVQNPAATPPPPSWNDPPGPVLSDPPQPPPPVLAPLPARSAIDAPLGSAIPVSATEVAGASRIISGKFGYSTDHTWLHGELDRHYRGFLDLRYRPASEEDTFGGKVRLEDDTRLQEFRAGDIIAVEGEMIRDADASIGQYPRFRIRTVRLIERK